jgi:O-Antigen ligase
MIPRIRLRAPLGCRKMLLPSGLSVGFVVLAFQNGGFAPSTYYLAGAALAVYCFGVSVQDPDRLSGRVLALPTALLVLSAWCVASLWWSADATAAVPDSLRLATYGLLALAVTVGSRGRSIGLLVGGAWVGCLSVASFGVLVRLVPGSSYARTAGVAGRLFVPIGYWNGLAMVAGIGLVLALGISVDGRAGSGRIVAAASAPILGLALYLTFSRGGIVVTVLGVAIAAISHRKSSRVLIAAAVCACGLTIPVAAAVLSPDLTANTLDPHSARAAAAVSLALICGCALAAILTWACVDTLALTLSRRCRRVDRVLRRAIVVGGAFATIGLISVLTLTASGAGNAPGSPNRLMSTTLEARPDLWRVAASEFASHPMLGIGAGGFARAWLRHRSTQLEAEFAHSAYLETAAETGVVGLALLLIAFGFAAAQGVAGRRRPFVPACLAAFAMFAVHAGVDWDWQLPAVGLLGVGMAACLVVANNNSARTDRPRSRAGALVTATLLATVGTVFVLAAIGAEHLEAAQHDINAGRWNAAGSEAGVARRWMPWSYEPWLVKGYAALGSGEKASARHDFRRGLAVDSAEWTLEFGLVQASDGHLQAQSLAAAEALNPWSRELRLYARLAGLPDPVPPS